MKTMRRSFSNKLFLGAAALALAMLGGKTQAAVGGWTNRYHGPGNADGYATAVAVGMVSPFSLPAAATDSADTAPAKASEPLPWAQLGAKAGADYKGDGLAVTPTADGARLRCVFQRLEGEATREGLWLTSTVTDAVNDRFRLVATGVGRVTRCALAAMGGVADGTSNIQPPTSNFQLSPIGNVSMAGQSVRFARPGLVEEYTVSMDGVRQDFLVLERPGDAGELALRLAVSGARVEPAAFGAQLVLENSGRKIAYSRLRVTDATGKELPARMEVMGSGHPSYLVRNGEGESASQSASYLALSEAVETGAHEWPEGRAPMLAVVVNDADAVYPVRIDPTFSDANWISMGGVPGANGKVYAVVIDGSGDLYIGGDFAVAGGSFADYIAKWNGSTWTALGSGMNGAVVALAVSGSDLYAGGYFTTAGGNAANYIAKWNGSSWSALGSGMNVGGTVFALAVSGSDLYAGGNITTAGGSAANYIAKWNGSSWSALGSGMNSYVVALAVSGSNVYAGGYFTTAGGSAANYVAKWNGSSWSALGSGIMAGGLFSVSALAVSGSDLYAGGYFTTAGGSAANSIAKWNGTSWSALGSGMDSRVDALAVSGSGVYAGGSFTTAGGSAASCIAKWNGSSWSALGSGMDGRVWALAAAGSNVAAGGNFATAGGSVANRIAKWNGSTWSALGSGMNGSVSALTMSGSDLYAGGDFTTAGGSAANHVTKWNGSSWSALGSGINGTVYALAVSGSNVYAGGYFSTAGGSAANYIAKWNGTSWSALGSGMGASSAVWPGASVFALAVSGSNLYAGGAFTSAGTSAAKYIAKWNGSSWSVLGSGMNSYVRALALLGSDVCAGGDFTTAGGSAANYVAKWNGSGWLALGSGMGGDVAALAVSGSDLYAGSYFSSVAVGKWNGSSWTALGSGMDNSVLALAVSGSDLYAGGKFSTAGASAANYVAKWNGSSWSALGSGMNYNVLALAASGSDLYVGGEFTTAGGKLSTYLARAYLLTLPTLSVRRSGTEVMISWPSPSTGFTLQQSTNLTTTNWTVVGTAPADDGTTKTVIVNPPTGTRFYRLKSP